MPLSGSRADSENGLGIRLLRIIRTLGSGACEWHPQRLTGNEFLGDYLQRALERTRNYLPDTVALTRNRPGRLGRLGIRCNTKQAVLDAPIGKHSQVYRRNGQPLGYIDDAGGTVEYRLRTMRSMPTVGSSFNFTARAHFG